MADQPSRLLPVPHPEGGLVLIPHRLDMVTEREPHEDALVVTPVLSGPYLATLDPSWPTAGGGRR